LPRAIAVGERGRHRWGTRLAPFGRRSPPPPPPPLGKEAAATAAAADGEGGCRTPSQLGKEAVAVGERGRRHSERGRHRSRWEGGCATASATVGEGFPFFSCAQDEPVRSCADNWFEPSLDRSESAWRHCVSDGLQVHASSIGTTSARRLCAAVPHVIFFLTYCHVLMSN
jgi:hypothetical protein